MVEVITIIIINTITVKIINNKNIILLFKISFIGYLILFYYEYPK